MEKVQHHLSSPAKTNGTLIHLVFLFFVFLHLLYSLSSLSLSFPPLSLSPILLLQGTVWTTAPVCSLSHVIFLFRCRWIFVIIWNSLQYISHCPQNVYHPCRKWVTLLGKTPIFGISTESKHRFSSNIAHCPYHQNAHCLKIREKRENGSNLKWHQPNQFLFEWGNIVFVRKKAYSIKDFAVFKVAEVVRRHGGPSPKSFDSDKKFKP